MTCKSYSPRTTVVSGIEAELGATDKCGCFHCLSTYSPQKIVEWTDDGRTALCPYCGIDSVIASVSAGPYPLSREFLRAMRRVWFRYGRRTTWLSRLVHALGGPWHYRRWLQYRELLERAVTDAEYHRASVLASRECGCYSCLAAFPPALIREWVEEDADGVAQTAVCPYCRSVNVLASADGYPITKRFLRDVARPFS